MKTKFFLRKTRFTVLWSGGKDSTAALLWVSDNIPGDNWNILYVEMTGNTHPLVNKYVHEVAHRLGIENRLIHARTATNFFEYMEKTGIPLLGRYRWCLRLKLDAFKKYGYPVQVTGVKRADSPRRGRLREVEYVRRTRTVLVHPILGWSDSDVEEYLKAHGIPVNPCYKLCGHSGNCMFCPYHSRAQILRTLQLPEWREKILETLSNTKCRGEISCGVRTRWLKLAMQRALTFTS